MFGNCSIEERGFSGRRSVARKAKAVSDMKPDNALKVEQKSDETAAQAMARKLMQPAFRNAVAASGFATKMLGSKIEQPGLGDYADYVQLTGEKAAGGDLAMASHILAAQALTLDNMFTELARRAALNMSEYVNAAERYGRLALKAQSNCRATLETLAKLHQPREQTVRHVHVSEGGQAVIADQFHNHAGGKENVESAIQCHTAGAAGTSAALPSPDAGGNGVPISGSARQAAVQDARRHKSRRA